MTPFIFDILTSTWLLHSTNPDAYGAILVSLLRGERFRQDDHSELRKANHSFVVNLNDGTDSQLPLGSKEIPVGSVAVIPIKGMIMKEDAFCGPRGSVSIANDILSAGTDPNIKSILLVINSPGGTASYTDILSETVKNCPKPVIAYVEGMAASAAYWIASGADKIICSSDLDNVGSIGTMLEYIDMKPYLEKEGVVFHEVYATLSTEKNQTLHDLRAGNYDDIRSNMLDRINAKFHANVNANRPALDPSALTGKIFFAADAIALGLVDEIGSYQYALDQANSDTASNSKFIPQNSNPIMKIKMLAAWTAIATFFNFTENIESKELTEEMVGQLNDKLADQSAENSTLKTALATAAEQLETVTAEKTELRNTLTAVNEAFAAFKNEDAASETRRGKAADKTEETIISDNYLHNRIADQNT